MIVCDAVANGVVVAVRVSVTIGRVSAEAENGFEDVAGRFPIRTCQSTGTTYAERVYQRKPVTILTLTNDWLYSGRNRCSHGRHGFGHSLGLMVML